MYAQLATCCILLLFLLFCDEIVSVSVSMSEIERLAMVNCKVKYVANAREELRNSTRKVNLYVYGMSGDGTNPTPKYDCLHVNLLYS